MIIVGLHRKEPRRVIWNEVECGGYEADLPLWEELAGELDENEKILELGCGAGRVVHHLASRFPQLVIGLDNDPNMVEAVWDRCHSIGGDAEFEDVRKFAFGSDFGLVLAPMQLIQLLANSRQRRACLTCVYDSLSHLSKAAFAIVGEWPEPLPESAPPPLPDVRQVDGWIYSSLPLEPIIEIEVDWILLRRLRQTVAPNGEMTEEMNEVEMHVLTAEKLEEEAAEVGFEPIGRREIPATEAHVGSTVVLLEKPI
jgi:SAM-dependent methyltransferase